MRIYKPDRVWSLALVSALLFALSAFTIKLGESEIKTPVPDTARIANTVAELENELDILTDSLVSNILNNGEKVFYSKLATE